MAEDFYPHPPEEDHDLFLEEISILDSCPYWSHDRMTGSTCEFGLTDDIPVEIGTENGVVSSSERNNQVTVAMDFFHQRVEESNLMDYDEIVSITVNDSSFGVIEQNHDVGLHPLELDLGLINEEHDNHDNDEDAYLMECDKIVLNTVSDSTSGEGNHDVCPHPLELELGFIDEEHDNDENANLMGCDKIVLNTVNDLAFGVIEGNHDVDLHPLELGSGLGLVDEVCDNHDNDNDEDYNLGGFYVSDCGDEFHIARRREKGSSKCDGSSSRVSGLRDVWTESDSDDKVEEIDDVLLGMHVHSDEEEHFGADNVNDDGGDLSVTLCWDSVHLEGEDHSEVNHDFEWEEVDNGVDEREEESISVLNFWGLEEYGDRGSRVSNSDWEVLLNHLIVNNLDINFQMENHNDDYIDNAEYEMMFGQFGDGENAISGKPPASKAMVERLPSVVITKKDVIDEKSLCAVCKDLIEVGKEGKLLPCSHLYHGDCIIPWLTIRNTCPVCRFELPADDPDYEQRRTRRSARDA